MESTQPLLHLISAVSRRDLVEMERLLKAGVNPNQLNGQGLMPIAMLAQAAPREETPAAMALLVQHGANINAYDRRQRTALATAARTGHTENVRALLDLGADPWLRDGDLFSPLGWAMDSMNIECAALLVRRCGWDEHYRSRNGQDLREVIRMRYAGDKVDKLFHAIEGALVERQADLLGQATVDTPHTPARPRL